MKNILLVFFAVVDLILYYDKFNSNTKNDNLTVIIYFKSVI